MWKIAFSGFSEIPSLKFPWNLSFNDTVRLQWCTSCVFYAYTSHQVTIKKSLDYWVWPKIAPNRAKFDPRTIISLLSVVKLQGKSSLHWIDSACSVDCSDQMKSKHWRILKRWPDLVSSFFHDGQIFVLLVSEDM